MAIDFSHYNPPGVYMNPQPGPQLAVNSSLPQAVALFGVTQGYQTYIETVQINPDFSPSQPTPTRTLAQAGINTATIVVTNPNSGAVFALGTDYTVVLISGTQNSNTALYALDRVISGGHINPGDFVQVSYQFTDSKFFTPKNMFDYQEVVSTYGAPYNVSAGTISSELTLAAQFAFLNGAHQLVTVAVQPTGSNNTAQISDYYNALSLLYDNPFVAVVVPCTGQQPLFQFVQEHVDQQSANNFERRAILGMDGTSVPVPSSQRIINAQEIQDPRIMLVDPATFKYFAVELNQYMILGGQYMAACLAGMTVSMSFAQPLTRKVITGWVDVAESELDGQKNLESQNGLCVVEKTRSQLIQVRHGVATDPTDLISREWSITGQSDAMVYRMRDYLNAAALIGQPIYPFTLVNVKASAEAALQSLLRDGLLVDYFGLKVRQLATNPDVIEVTYSWLPAFPLNYIVVTFSVSLTGGTINSTSGTTGNNVTNASALQAQIGVPQSFSNLDFGGASNTLLST